MSSERYYEGQRLSLRSQCCTTRYVGEVDGKQGIWLGVEWDEETRGKHDGTHEGREYFICRSQSATAASFLRPNQKWDQSRTFLEALSSKYFKRDEARSDEIIYVSRSKAMEEIGFEKFAQRQAELRGIAVIVLDRMFIQHPVKQNRDKEIEATCANVSDLDLASNLFETYEGILDLCSQLPKLRRLSIAGNRFIPLKTDAGGKHSTLRLQALDLSNTLLSQVDVSICLTTTPGLEELSLAANGIRRWDDTALLDTICKIDLSDNLITSIDQVRGLLKLPKLTHLKLQRNQIREIWQQEQEREVLSSTLMDLDLAGNSIQDWLMLDHLRSSIPALENLRLTGNPMFENIRASDGKSLTKEDGYMLAIARLPGLKTLNYSVISDTERLNAEKYYMSQIVLQLSQTDAANEADILRQHPRWPALCEEYGTPEVQRAHSQTVIDPKSLAARLVTVDFVLSNAVASQHSTRTWTESIPKAFNMYAVYGIVGKKLRVMPLSLRLIWETEELDPIGQESTAGGPDWWDSSEDEFESQALQTWTKRAVELVPGTRALGTYLDGSHAKVRVERAKD